MEVFIIVFLIFAGIFLLLRQENKRKIEYNNHKNEQIESVTALERGTWSERDLVYELLEHGIAPGAIFHDLYVKNTGTNCRHESKEKSRKTGKFLARATGLEPVTYGLTVRFWRF